MDCCCCWLLLVVDCCWLLLVVFGCWLLLVVGCCWLLVVAVVVVVVFVVVVGCHSTNCCCCLPCCQLLLLFTNTLPESLLHVLHWRSGHRFAQMDKVLLSNIREASVKNNHAITAVSFYLNQLQQQLCKQITQGVTTACASANLTRVTATTKT